MFGLISWIKEDYRLKSMLFSMFFLKDIALQFGVR